MIIFLLNALQLFSSVTALYMNGRSLLHPKGVKTTTRELEDMEYDVSLLGGYADEDEISQDITEMLIVVMQVLSINLRCVVTEKNDGSRIN